MTLPPPLALRVPAKAHETPASLLDRLSARHREDDPVAFGRSCEVDREALLFGRGVDRLVALAGFGPDAPSLASPRIEARNRAVALGDDVVALGDWDARGMRFCPGCVMDDADAARASGRPREVETYRRFWWDVGSVTHCHRHGVALRASCRRCGTSSAWSGRPGRCRDCDGWLGGRPTPGAKAPGLASYLQARLVGATTQVPLLDGLQVKDVVTQVARMGLALVTGPGRFKPRDDAHDLHAARDVGFTAAENWPGPFVTALDDLLATTAREPARRRGMIASYGWVYEHWAEALNPATAFGRAVRSVLREHAVRHQVIPENDPILADRGPCRGTNLTAAARSLGWGYARTRREAARRGLVGAGARRGVGIQVDLSVLRAGGEAAAPLSVAQVGARLGVGKVQAGRLAASGLLAPVGDGGRADLEPAHCDRFVERLTAGLPRLAVLPPGAETLPRACRSRQVPLEVACRLIVDGAMRPLGLVGPMTGLASVVVAVDGMPPRERRDPEIATVEEAARMLGLHHETVRYLARRGHLRRVRDGRVAGFRTGCLRLFRDLHLSGTEVARALGTSPRTAARKLAGLDVRPLAAPPACRQNVFLRADVERHFAVPAR